MHSRPIFLLLGLLRRRPTVPELQDMLGKRILIDWLLPPVHVSEPRRNDFGAVPRREYEGYGLLLQFVG